MQKVFDFLKGKKTYILSALSLVLAALLQFGVIEQESYTTVMTLLTPLGLATLRAAVVSTDSGSEKKN